MKNFYDPYNKFKFDGIAYTKSEIKKSILCLKSVNRDSNI